ncbi:PA3496 family putative envelope integrity protein [Pseudomonas sp. NCCP-436]|uniref:PA3496 family putative envelope integrity protein n=1 Tax=Pseudomonas sp. NCCP-436 TaxID=2842481 RepID=UPI001C7E2236|nr:transcriptional regulator [Pseudomonas sp. NCCP-436]GIZ10727.1 hypothetical protein NCCP436_01430 [Pseudomonas sp. NCCP-436]
MPRYFAELNLPAPTDASARRKLQEQRRMAYRKAIEHYAEQRRLQRDLADFPELHEPSRAA